jgi:small GTP-binding protein
MEAPRQSGDAGNFTVCLIGDTSVGKTSLAQALAHQELPGGYTPTIGCSMVRIPWDSNGIHKGICICDTAGMEKYRALAPAYYRNSIAAIAVFDLSKLESFTNVNNWITFYRESVESRPPILLLGNKLDLERAVPSEDAQSYASANGLTYLEVSVKEGTNMIAVLPTVDRFFEVGKVEHEIALNSPPKRGCC